MLKEWKPTWLEETKPVLSSGSDWMSWKRFCKKVLRVWSSGHHCFQAHPAHPMDTSLRTQGRQWHISPFTLLLGWLDLTQNFPFQDMCLARDSDSLKLQSTIKGIHSSSILFAYLSASLLNCFTKRYICSGKKAQIISKRQKKASSTMLVVSHRFELLSCNFS